MRRHGTEIDCLLEHYVSICSLLKRCENPDARRLQITIENSLKQIQEATSQQSVPFTSSQLRTGLRQGLRDTLHVLRPKLANEAKEIREALEALLAAIKADLAPKKARN